MTMSNKDKVINNDAEFGVDSRYTSKTVKHKDSVALMEARLERMKALPKEQSFRARLMQLKLRMEEYLKKPVYDNQHHFAQFLAFYIDTVHSKRNDFAKDINVTSNYLSKVIHSHLEPNEALILKLMIHSEKTFENVIEFQKKTWLQVYFHEKLCAIMSSQEQWRPEIENQVKFTHMASK